MKAIYGKLPVDRKYKLIETIYSEYYGGLWNCENCGRAIKNIAVIKDEFGNEFKVGLECLETFINLEPNSVLQAEKELRRKKKFYNYIKNECKTIIIRKYKDFDKEVFFSYKFDVQEWEACYNWRGVWDEEVKNLVKKFNIKITEIKD